MPDQKFTGQRLDGTGLYYYNARYYDPAIGRFISADTVVQDFRNPQTLNRYSYCLNNPLKYIDPSGHAVVIKGIDVRWIYDIPYVIRLLMGMEDDYWAAVCSVEFAYYDAFRNIDPDVARTVENSNIQVSIKTGYIYTPWGTIDDARVAEYDPKYHSITLNRWYKDYFSSGITTRAGILATSHEMKHAWQDVMLSEASPGSLEEKKWSDWNYREWDAYKYEGNLDDKLGWHRYWFLGARHCWAQTHNLDVSYSYYKTWSKWFGYPQKLTAEDYSNN